MQAYNFRVCMTDNPALRIDWQRPDGHDPRVPDPLRRAFGRWGLPRHEFAATGHWPHQLYVREARRMVADHVITGHECNARFAVDNPVGMGGCTMDSQNCSRFVAEIDGKAVVLNEGDVHVAPNDPYPISDRGTIPRRGKCEKLGVPVCFSALHIAYGSARIQPAFRVLGEGAACAACEAIDGGVPLQEVAYPRLPRLLEKAGQVPEDPDPGGERGVPIS